MAANNSSTEESALSHGSHPLLDELKGLLARLKFSSQPIKDGHAHLVPFCETLEAVFRDGLKQPNSWFGFNKQDYWCWIEPLQDYYFDKKQNPIFSKLVHDIQTLESIRSLQARGRCFLRSALHHKLISVPVEHLAKNLRLTSYWYKNGSIIATVQFRETLMDTLFEATAVDFDLDYAKTSFLDETWIIPVYLECQLPPIKQLDMGIVHIDKRELIVSIDDDCLAQQAGIERWDILDELCGKPVNTIRSGTLQTYIAKNSVDHTLITVVKKYLPNGSPFGPALQRQLAFTHKIDVSPTLSWLPEILQRESSSPLIRSEGESTEYTLVYLGKSECTASSIGQELIDNSITQILNQSKKPEISVLNVNRTMVQLTTSRPLLQCGYQILSICGQSSKHPSCLALFVLEGFVDGEEGKDRKRVFASYVCEAPTSEFANCICCHIAQGFTQDLRLSSSSTTE